MTAWHLAAEWGKLEELHKVWDCVEKKVKTEEINNKLLLNTDNEVWTVGTCLPKGRF